MKGRQFWCSIACEVKSTGLKRQVMWSIFELMLLEHEVLDQWC